MSHLALNCVRAVVVLGWAGIAIFEAMFVHWAASVLFGVLALMWAWIAISQIRDERAARKAAI